MDKPRKHAGGRPPLGDLAMQRVTVFLPREYVAWAKAEGGQKGLGEGLRRLLEELDQRQGADR